MRNLLLLGTALAFSQTGVVVYLAFAALTGYWLAEDKALATLPLALQFVGMALVVIPVSALMRRQGRRTGFILGQLLGALGAALAAVSVWFHQFELFCVSAVLIGAHNAIWQHYRFAALECAQRDHRSLAVGLVLSGGVVAALLGGPMANIGGPMLGVLYAGGYALVSGLCLVTLGVLCFLKIEQPLPETAAQDRGAIRSTWQILCAPKFVLAVTVSSISFAAMAFVMNATPLAMQLCGFAIGDSNLVVQLHTLGMFAPSFFTGALIRWQGHRLTILAGTLAFCAAIGVNLSGISFYHFAGALMLVGLGWNLMFISATDLLAETYRPAEKEKSQGIHDLMMFVVVGISNYFAGYSLLGLGWQGVNGLVLIPLVVLALFLLRPTRSGVALRSGAS